MKQTEIWKYCLMVSAALFCLLFAVPLLTVEVTPPPVTAPPQGSSPSSEGNSEPTTILPPGEVDSGYTVRVLKDGELLDMTMSAYLQGVVRAEMPASFAQEALCAQAVAARSYTLYKMVAGGGNHPEADICTDAACCQAYLDKEAAMTGWGAEAERNEAKIQNAVSATDGQTMVYGGVPVLAVFHSSSAGQTRRAGEVWSSDLPYLQSVSSPENSDSVPNYYSRVEVDGTTFRRIFLAAHPEAVFSDKAEKWITNLLLTEDGRYVSSVTVGGVAVRGVEMRQLYGLRSAAFDVEAEKGNVVFFVTGYGHGVGMSQYGANGMAQRGASWREILLHYYTGVSIEVRGR